MLFEFWNNTDMRKSIDGLIAIVSGKLSLDPCIENELFLFCGRRADRIKALHYSGDGFELLYKRLDSTGRFRWPRNETEARKINRQQFRWLMEGLEIDQPRAIHSEGGKRDI